MDKDGKKEQQSGKIELDVKDLECPVCKNFIFQPTIMCGSNHIACWFCVDNPCGGRKCLAKGCTELKYQQPTKLPITHPIAKILMACGSATRYHCARCKKVDGLTYQELLAHADNQCPLRFVTCPYCTKVTGTAERVLYHILNLCTDALHCTVCGDYYRSADGQQHTELFCKGTLLYCPLDNCSEGKALPRSELTKHMESDEIHCAVSKWVVPIPQIVGLPIPTCMLRKALPDKLAYPSDPKKWATGSD